MIKKLFSIFSRKEERPAPVVQKRLSSTNERGVNSLKKEVSALKTNSSKLNDELTMIKKHVSDIPDHRVIIEKFHAKHEAHEKSFATHAEKFNHVESKLQDQRIDIIELKSRLNELNRSVSRYESLFGKMEAIEKKAAEIQ